MASINKHKKSGSKFIQFYNASGERKTIRVGKLSERDAEKIKTKIEELNNATINCVALETETTAWLSKLPDKTYEKLVKVGLAVPRVKKPNILLGSFLDDYISKRPDVKKSTTQVYERTKKHLIEFFGKDKPIDKITVGDAKDWRLWLSEKQKLGTNTVGRTTGIAKQFLNDAVDRELISKNPFKKLSAQVCGNAARAYFISREDAQKVLDACPDAEWRLIFALSRFGGLRCPSEHFCLRWKDVDFVNERMTIHSPKTEHHKGKAQRIIPIFPELKPYLEDAFQLAKDGEINVISRYRAVDLRNQFENILKKAGLKPWPKLFQNLRATRETELAREVPIYVVCDWMGNTALIAAKHYLQVTEADFASAIKPAEAKALPKALPQNAAQRDTPSSGVAPIVDFPEENPNLLDSLSNMIVGRGLWTGKSLSEACDI